MKKILSLSLVAVASLVLLGCGSSNKTKEVTKVEELSDVKKMGHSILDSANIYTSEAKNSTSDIMADDKANTSPIVVDSAGNIQKGGILKYFDESGHSVIIEAIETNVLLYKIDANGDGKYSDAEVEVEKFDGEIYNQKAQETSSEKQEQLPTSHIDKIYGSSLKAILDAKAGETNYISDSEEINIVVVLYVDEIDYEYGNYNLSGSADIFGNVKYYYNGDEISATQMAEIEKKLNAERKAYNQLKREKIKEILASFISRNNLAISNSIQESLDEGKDTFELSLTKSEIKSLVNKNARAIIVVELKPIISNMGTIN